MAYDHTTKRDTRKALDGTEFQFDWYKNRVLVYVVAPSAGTSHLVKIIEDVPFESYFKTVNGYMVAHNLTVPTANRVEK